MPKVKRHVAMTVALTLLASLYMVIVPTTANAAESVPPLQWPAVNVANSVLSVVTGPNGDVTVPCTNNGGDLQTYNSSGQLVRDIPRTDTIDGVRSCITTPVVDKNGVVYGTPYGQVGSGSPYHGPNLLAYNGNTLKWKYPVYCGNDQAAQYAVGANGNIYATTGESDGEHLIGLTPDVAPGQTQPSKVFDVKIPNDCSILIHPYKDGIMLQGQSSGNASFYSYGGKALGVASIGDIWREQVNASGQMFVPKMVSGSFTSANVSMYDPLSGQVVWTTSASTSGANVQNVTVYPLASGGVAALIYEQKMVSPGIPATPTEYVYTVATLNSVGQKVNSVTLPSKDAQGNVLGTVMVAPSSDGRLTLVREIEMKTGISYPTTVPAVWVAVYDPASGSWPYQQIMSGDLTKVGGPYGYFINNPQQVGNNTLYLLSGCSGNCNPTGQKLWPVTVAGLGVDYPRGTISGTRVLLPYVALGDSYSSGEGTAPFDNGTDVVGTNICHRSYYAYARVLTRSMDTGLSLSMGSFNACSGAKTPQINGSWPTDGHINLNESPQLAHLNASTKVVTITIGGNDIMFKEFATACVDPTSSCSIRSSAYNTSLNLINTTLPGSLKSTYEQILQATQGGGAKVYVLGYPEVVPVKSSGDPIDTRCPYLFDGGSGWGDAQAARGIVTSLDAAIKTEVDIVRAESSDSYQRLRYVDVNASTSPFVGHEICSSGDSYFQNVDQGTYNQAFVFHPNAQGQQAYASLVLSAMNAG